MKPQRLIFWILYFFLGVAPSLLFFIWVERNCTLPYLASFLEFPWINLSAHSPKVALAFNFFLIPIFGVIHTATAQISFRNFLSQQNISEPYHRGIYMMITGITSFLVCAFWQNTGAILWVVPGVSWFYLQTISFSLFVFFMFFATRSFLQDGFLDLMGATPTTPELRTDGVYSYIRHPMYAFTICAFIITPMMSLDRGIVALTSILYLAVGIPIEERKLAALFGQKFLDYKARVPALIPRFMHLFTHR